MQLLGRLPQTSNGPTQQKYERTWEYDHTSKPRFLTQFRSDSGEVHETHDMTAEAGGNVLEINEEPLYWNAQNRLHQNVAVDIGPPGTFAYYDAFDNRTIYMPQSYHGRIISVGSDFEYDTTLEQSTKFFFVNGERIASRAVLNYIPDTAWTLSWPYRRIVKPLAPAALPVGTGLFLLGLVGLAGIHFRRRNPAWLTVPGVGLLSFGLVIYPIHPALAVPGGGNGPTWHGGHSQGIMIYGNDHLGSTRVVLNNLGETVETRDYAPFGKTIAHTGDYALKHQFTSQTYDDTADLYHYGARMYNADWGRFISPDERVEGFDSQGLNPYTYVLNQPTSAIDPSGHATIKGIEYIVGTPGGTDNPGGNYLQQAQQARGAQSGQQSTPGGPASDATLEQVSFDSISGEMFEFYSDGTVQVASAATYAQVTEIHNANPPVNSGVTGTRCLSITTDTVSIAGIDISCPHEGGAMLVPIPPLCHVIWVGEAYLITGGFLLANVGALLFFPIVEVLAYGAAGKAGAEEVYEGQLRFHRESFGAVKEVWLGGR